MHLRPLCVLYVRPSNLKLLLYSADISGIRYNLMLLYQNTYVLKMQNLLRRLFLRSHIFNLIFPIFHLYYLAFRSRDSVVDRVTGYGLDGRGFGVRVPVGSSTFSSPRRPDRLWGPPNLLPKRYRGLFPRGLKRPGRELTTHLQLVSR
jgi:hypothetical protein